MKSVTPPTSNDEKPMQSPKNDEIIDQNEFNKSKARSPKSFKINMYLEKINTQENQVEDSQQKIRDALLKKYDVSLTGIPEETKIFSTIQESK